MRVLFGLMCMIWLSPPADLVDDQERRARRVVEYSSTLAQIAAPQASNPSDLPDDLRHALETWTGEDGTSEARPRL